MKRRQYRPGREIKSMALLSRELLARRYVWFFGRPCHPSWLRSMQFNCLENLIRRRAFRLALRREIDEQTRRAT